MDELQFIGVFIIAGLIVFFSGTLLKTLIKEDYKNYRVVKEESKNVCDEIVRTEYFIEFRKKLFKWKWWVRHGYSGEDKDRVIKYYKEKTIKTDTTYIQEDICKL